VSHPKPIPALSLWQPWASLCTPPGPKYLETRSWQPSPDMVGRRVAIAATGVIPKEAKDFVRPGAPTAQPLLDAVRACGFHIAWDRKSLKHNLPHGQVLCTATLAGIYPMVDSGAGMIPTRCILVAPTRLLLVSPEGDRDVTDQRPFGIFEPGRYAFHLTNRRAVVGRHPAKGHQQFWNWRPTGIYDAA
jgi:hypothetical protein